MMTLGIFGLEVNRQFHYPKYFCMLPTGPEGVRGFSKGFFDLAGRQSPTPETMAIAVETAGSLDHDRLAIYLRNHSFETVIGDLSFAQDGEWAKTRSLFTQFRHVTGNRPVS